MHAGLHYKVWSEQTDDHIPHLEAANCERDRAVGSNAIVVPSQGLDKLNIIVQFCEDLLNKGGWTIAHLATEM